MGEMNEDCSFLLLDLPWEDIVMCKILPKLQLKDCVNLMEASPKFRKLVIAYFQQLKEFKSENEYPQCPLKDLTLLANNTFELRVLDLSHWMTGHDSDWNSADQDLFKHIVRTFLLNNRQLIHVNLSRTSLADTDLYSLIYCEKLQTLVLDGCSWLTREFWVTVKHHCPHVVISNKTIQRKNALIKRRR